MSRSDIARGLLDAFNSGDWTQVEASIAPDAIYDEFGTGRRGEGRDEILEMLQGWKQTMPDAKGTVTSAVDHGDEVIMEVTWKGTMTGPWGEIPATGKQQTTRAAWFLTFSGDEISDSRQYFDSLGLLQQLGVMPEPATA